VNFLLHHHLASLDHPGRPEVGAGAMLPDVWRMADRRARPRRDRDEERPAGALPEAAAVPGVMLGIAHHLDVDSWFHRADVFTRGERAARVALRTAPRAPKMGLFAHVAWELCLDGALVRRTGIASVLEAVGTSVAAARPEAHRLAADRLVDLPPADRAIFDVRVDAILDAIVRGPWVAGYGTADGIVERLDGVRLRMGFVALDPADRDAVARAIEALEDDADAALDELRASPRA
jgi:hypothetical protein